MGRCLEVSGLNNKLCNAVGTVRIDLTDPITGKVKHRVDGENHVFTEALATGNNRDWVSALSSAWLCLHDSAAPLDTSFPYLLGDAVGYGRPSHASYGLLRGAYNVNEQVLAYAKLDRLYWKFKYDFTTAQANVGTIRNIGLTKQFFGDVQFPIKGTRAPSTRGSVKNIGASDGLYTYEITTAGVVKKTNVFTGAYENISVTAFVNTTSLKYVAYEPSTDKFYIIQFGQGTPANSKVFEFSNSTFSTLIATHSVPALTSPSGIIALYVCAGRMLGVSQYYSGYYVLDFKNNIDWVATSSIPIYAGNINEGSTAYNGSNLSNSHIGVGNYAMFQSLNSYSGRGLIFDLATMTVAGHTNRHSTSDSSVMLLPSSPEKMVCDPGYDFSSACAATTYILPEPVTKTSANGMSVTYELEVMY